VTTPDFLQQPSDNLFFFVGCEHMLQPQSEAMKALENAFKEPDEIARPTKKS
jgi:hypothetical protein